METRKFMKILFILITVFLTPSVLLSQTTEQSKNYRLPKIVFKNVKANHKRLKSETFKRIISPLLCENEKRIEEVIVDFCGERGCQAEKNTGNPLVKVAVNWFDGSSAVIYVEINGNGSFDGNEYLRLFGNGREKREPKEDCASKETKKP